MSLNENQSTKLEEAFDAARIRKREGPGGKELSFLPGHDVIRTANRIFGYGAWGHEIVELVHIGTERYSGKAYGDKPPQKKVRVAYRCSVVLTVEGARPTSGVGYGDATENYYEDETHLTAHELAMKESETDAMKRALKNFGDQFGLALYDEERRKMLEGSASQDEIAAAIVAIVVGGGDKQKVLDAIEGQRDKYAGLVPRGWLQRQVARASGDTPEPEPDMGGYG